MKIEYGKVGTLPGLVAVVKDAGKINRIYLFNCKELNEKFIFEYLEQKGLNVSEAKKTDLKYLADHVKGKKKLKITDLDMSGITDFRKNVYKKLMDTKPGKILTYSGLAEAIAKAGSTLATRAVGSAMKQNPFPLVVPCHRVSSKDAIKTGRECFSISCFSKKPKACSKVDVLACSKRIKNMIREFEISG